MSERMSGLLRAAVTEFDRLRSPFSTEWLSAHAVTLDECADLSVNIGNAIRVYLQTPTVERVRLLTHDLYKNPVPTGVR